MIMTHETPVVKHSGESQRLHGLIILGKTMEVLFGQSSVLTKKRHTEFMISFGSV